MNLSEFGGVVNFILKTYTAKNLNAVYTEIETLLEQNLTAPTDELSAQIKSKIRELLKLHESIEPDQWSYTQQKYFEKLGAHEHFGIGAKTRIQDVLNDGMGDSGYVLRRFKELHTSLNDFNQRVTQIKSSMGTLFDNTFVTLEEGRAVLQIVFDERVSIEAVDELTKQSKDWDQILNWFTDAISTDHASPKIISISKESPVTITLDGQYAVIGAIGIAVAYLIDLRYKVLKIEEQRLINKKLKIEDPGETIDKAYQKQSENIVEKGIAYLKKITVDQYKTKDNGDKVTGLNMAIDILKDFIFGGGRADTATEVNVDDIPQDEKGPRKGIGYVFQLAPVYEKVQNTETLIYTNRKLLEAQHQKELEEKQKAKEIKKTESKSKPTEAQAPETPKPEAPKSPEES